METAAKQIARPSDIDMIVDLAYSLGKLLGQSPKTLATSPAGIAQGKACAVLARVKAELGDRALTADDAWSAELSRAFKGAAGDIRYTKQGEGEPGTDLRRAYDAFKAARDAWVSIPL